MAGLLSRVRAGMLAGGLRAIRSHGMTISVISLNTESDEVSRGAS